MILPTKGPGERERMSASLSANLRKPYAILKKEFLSAISYRFDFLFRILSIWLSIFIYYFLAKLINPALSKELARYGGNYFSFVIIGTAFSGYLDVGLDSFSNAIREAQLMGTLEAVLVTRTRFTLILLYQALWNFFFASLHVILYVGFAFLFFGPRPENPDWLAAIVILLLTILAFSALGILSGSFILVFKKGTPVNWLIYNFSRLLGGVYYPVTLLPLWCQKFAALLPITYSLEGIRLALIRGHSLMDLRPQVVALVVFIIILFPASILCFNAAFERARKDGTLSHY
jgi:ABC-2 type transport system permease protein